MKYWKDEAEAVKAFVTLWETLSKDPEFIEGMKKVNQLVQLYRGWPQLLFLRGQP